MAAEVEEESNDESELELFLKTIDLGQDHESIVNLLKNDRVKMEEIMELQPHEIGFSNY